MPEEVKAKNRSKIGDIPEERLRVLREGNFLPATKKRKVADFEKEQDRFVEKLKHLDIGDFTADLREEEKDQERAKVAIYVSFAANVLLTIAKLIILILSGSISVLASFVDSILDLASGSIVFIATHFQTVRLTDIYKYPVGKRRLEVLAVIVFSAVMFTASAQIIIQAIQYCIEPDRLNLEVDYVTIAVIAATCVIKFSLWFLCRRSESPSVVALANDHKNDIFSNSLSLATVLIGYYIYKIADPIGGIIISAYIMWTWANNGLENVRKMTGKSADPKFLSILTYLASRHNDKIVAVDTIRAYYISAKYLVEVDIILPQNMPLREAHDIGESLQQKIEQLPEVERAFVHLDFEFEHRHHNEHPAVDLPKSIKRGIEEREAASKSIL